MTTKKTAREHRYDLITIVYQNELLGKKMNSKAIFEEFDMLTTFQIKQIEVIEDKYLFITSIIKHYLLETWKWEKLSCLLRAILIVGVAELIYANPKIVINEMIEIAKDYDFDDKQVKFINAILDKISKNIEYLKTKNENQVN
ncbi:transcription termination factor [Mycoplasmopsis californica]|uniref:Transcription antitermination protein NusB n=1 Tax=Mycoplasmopsis equigenitalium TaxID=114883 RepID=A0ABY5J5S6_9BACT|nr:transcription antitermination factor NusB [Mycoplasmopsis equigenitalium]UUD37043.1 transcription antitermination protein NusB [Mycoplasmopsis equigenitalium]VEU69657.1 transcription termination factor [Mycoplasmopsis californica]